MANPAPGTARRHSAIQWTALVKRYREPELSQHAFAEREGIGVERLRFSCGL